MLKHKTAIIHIQILTKNKLSNKKKLLTQNKFQIYKYINLFKNTEFMSFNLKRVLFLNKLQ